MPALDLISIVLLHDKVIVIKVTLFFRKELDRCSTRHILTISQCQIFPSHKTIIRLGYQTIPRWQI